MSITVLAFDPGYDRLGVSVVRGPSGSETLVHSTCLQTERSATPEQRLYSLGIVVEDLLRVHQPEAVALERLFFNKNVSTAIGVAEVRGMLLYLAVKYNCKVAEYSPQEIKVAITGYGNSDKRAVTKMVQQLVPGIPTQALDDEYDAIAVAITYLAHYGRDR